MLTLDQKIDRILDKVAHIEQAQRKTNWVSAKWIMKLTGWSAKDMDSAREQGLIEWKYKNPKTMDGGIIYLLQSVPDEFKIK